MGVLDAGKFVYVSAIAVIDYIIKRVKLRHLISRYLCSSKISELCNRDRSTDRAIDGG